MSAVRIKEDVAGLSCMRHSHEFMQPHTFKSLIGRTLWRQEYVMRAEIVDEACAAPMVAAVHVLHPATDEQACEMPMPQKC